MDLRIGIDVNLYHHFPERITADALVEALNVLEETIMSKITDKINEASSSADAAISRVGDDVDALEGRVAQLQQMVADGGASQADLDALDALKAKLDALDPTKPATLPEGTPTLAGPTAPVEPAPPTEPATPTA